MLLRDKYSSSTDFIKKYETTLKSYTYFRQWLFVSELQSVLKPLITYFGIEFLTKLVKTYTFTLSIVLMDIFRGLLFFYKYETWNLESFLHKFSNLF